MLYGNATNFSSFTRTHIASSQSIPARYYVPERLRAVHQIQLEKEGMWEVEAGDHNDGKKRGKGFSISKRDDVTSIEEKNEYIGKSKKKIKQAFGKVCLIALHFMHFMHFMHFIDISVAVKISAKSRSQCDILERLLESNGYLIYNRYAFSIWHTSSNWNRNSADQTIRPHRPLAQCRLTAIVSMSLLYSSLLMYIRIALYMTCTIINKAVLPH